MSDNQKKLNEQLLNVVLSDKDSDEAKLKKVKYLIRLGADVNAKDCVSSVLVKDVSRILSGYADANFFNRLSNSLYV